MLKKAADALIILLAKLVDTTEHAIFRLVKWRTGDDELPDFEDDFEEEDPLAFDEDVSSLDDPESDENSYLSFRRMDLGDFTVTCPECQDRDNVVLMGIQLFNDEEDSLECTAVGMIAYACGDITYSPCLTDKIAHILNAADEMDLHPSMFSNLETCDEHEVLYIEE